MFTNLDFLNIGKKWVPDNKAFRERQKNFCDGRKLYEGKFDDVFSETWEKIKSRYGNEKVMVALNLFRSLTETFKILAFKDEPVIWVGEGEKAEQIDKYYKPLHVINLLKKAFISVHSQGEGVFKVYNTASGSYDIAVVNPEMWIPVYNPENMEEIDYHVVANIKEVNNSSTLWGITTNSTERYLNVEIHSKGSYEHRVYLLNEFNELTKLVSSEIVKTGLNNFCVFPFNYNSTAWREWGLSAYSDLIAIVDEIVVRLSNNSKILDENADPQLIVPLESMQRDKNTGEYYYDRHNALAIGRNGERPEYLTWDGNLTSSENQLNRMMDLFYQISGTNPQLFGRDIAGNLSGEALAKIFIVPIAKVKEMISALKNSAEEALKCAIKLQTNEELEVNIEFNIGDFNSIEDIVERVSTMKNNGIISLQNAVEKVNPEYTEIEVNEEIERIKEEKESDFATDLENIYPKDEEKENA